MMNNATVYGITSYHARYFANEISCRRTDENRLSQSLFDAKVDLNPHREVFRANFRKLQ